MAAIILWSTRKTTKLVLRALLHPARQDPGNEIDDRRLWFCRKFDRDGNGYISPDELLTVVCNSGEKLSREEAEELIGMFDKNEDGQLSWEEFVEFFKCDRDAPEANMTISEEDFTEEDTRTWLLSCLIIFLSLLVLELSLWIEKGFCHAIFKAVWLRRPVPRKAFKKTCSNGFCLTKFSELDTIFKPSRVFDFSSKKAMN